MPVGAHRCQRCSTCPCPPAAGDGSSPGIQGSWPKVLLTQPRAALSSVGQECHVPKPPFPRENQPRGLGQCPPAGAGLTLREVEGVCAVGTSWVAFHTDGDEKVPSPLWAFCGHQEVEKVTWEGSIPL